MDGIIGISVAMLVFDLSWNPQEPRIHESLNDRRTPRKGPGNRMLSNWMWTESRERPNRGKKNLSWKTRPGASQVFAGCGPRRDNDGGPPQRGAKRAELTGFPLACQIFSDKNFLKYDAYVKIFRLAIFIGTWRQKRGLGSIGP